MKAIQFLWCVVLLQACGGSTQETAGGPLATATSTATWREPGRCSPEDLGDANGWQQSAASAADFEYAFMPGDLPIAERTCVFRLVRGGSTNVVTLGEKDCSDLRCWLTSDELLSALDTVSPSSSGAESLALQLQDGELHEAKFANSQEEAFVIHRAMLAEILDVYFPALRPFV